MITGSSMNLKLKLKTTKTMLNARNKSNRMTTMKRLLLEIEIVEVEEEVEVTQIRKISLSQRLLRIKEITNQARKTKRKNTSQTKKSQRA